MEASLFNNLPAEIRNSIYAYTLREQDGARINSEPALLRTCKQIRGEASLMYWAINRFLVNVHEEKISHDLCHWLKKAASRLWLVQSLTVQIEMPSVGSRTEAPEDEAHEAFPASFNHLMHIVDTLRQADWRRSHIENLIDFKLNGACDSETFEKIDGMSLTDQDRFRGSKFFLLCLVHGAVETAQAMEGLDGHDSLEKKDERIQWRRLTHASSISTSVEAS